MKNKKRHKLSDFGIITIVIILSIKWLVITVLFEGQSYAYTLLTMAEILFITYILEKIRF